MPKQKETSPRPPLEQDAEQVIAAVRRLIEIGCAEDTALINRLGCWPVELQPPASNRAHAIINPVSYACHIVLRDMIAHLGTLIGAAEAQAAALAIVEDQKATPAVRASLEMLAGLNSKAQAAAGPSPSASVH